MKNKQINPGQVPHLVRVTADLFRTMREEVKAPNNALHLIKAERNQMYFMVDLLKDLMDMTYPKFITITETSPFSVEQFEKAMKNIGKMVKDYKPPKAGEF